MGQRCAGAADRKRLVLVAAAVREQLQRIGQLVVYLERVAVGIGEIDAALIDMIGGSEDLDPLLDQVSVSLAQRGIAVDLEGDVRQPDLPALRARSLVWGRM